jgi:hypothetical protein
MPCLVRAVIGGYRLVSGQQKKGARPPFLTYSPLLISEEWLFGQLGEEGTSPQRLQRSLHYFRHYFRHCFPDT